MYTSADEISQLSASELDALFRAAEAGPTPNGVADGKAILLPGTPVEPVFEKLARAVAWRGKVIDAASGTLRNRITPADVRTIAADVYSGRSRVDERDCIVLDYSKRSLVARWVRDELRRVAPGLYLGIAYLGTLKVLYFTLQFADAS